MRSEDRPTVVRLASAGESEAAERLSWISQSEAKLAAAGYAGLRVGMIDAEAAAAYRADWAPKQGSGRFEWDVFTRIPYYQEMADRFEAAVWFGDSLVGLGIGEADLEVGYVARDFVERAPTAAGEKFRGQMVPIMNLCLETWAEIKGAGHVCIFDPNLQSVERLGAFGFEYVNALEALGEEIGPAFYSYCQRRVLESAPELPFVYSPVDLDELGEASDPFDRFGNDSHIPAEVTRLARQRARGRGLLE